MQIVGRKEAVEEARKRLAAQIEKLQDETSETITIKRAIQPALIGSGGKYAIRLEEKYGVKLSFPRDKESDEVSIRGGRKGVAQAKAELLEAAAYEAESRQSATFTVPTRAVSQIVGKSGATINGIKDESGAQIDIDKTPEGGKTTITVRGDKKAIAAAKAAILAVSESVGDETSVEVTIEQKYHRTLIGQGGSKLREIIQKAGGPEEGYKQAGLVTFPKGDAEPDTVKLRGEKGLVSRIKAEFEKQVAVLRETKVVGVVVAKDQHAAKIGRGGMALNALQRETGAT
jgi:predicted PilT family ATPase